MSIIFYFQRLLYLCICIYETLSENCHMSLELHTVTGSSCPFMSMPNYKSMGGPVYPVFVQRLQIYSPDHTLILQCLKYNNRDDTWLTLTTLISIENRKACTFIKWIITQTWHHLNAGVTEKVLEPVPAVFGQRQDINLKVPWQCSESLLAPHPATTRTASMFSLRWILNWKPFTSQPRKPLQTELTPIWDICWWEYFSQEIYLLVKCHVMYSRYPLFMELS